jgi:hypothetical protein
MNGQLLITSLTIAAAAGYLLRQAWRTWFGRKAGCGGSCGCSSQTHPSPAANGQVTFIAPDQLTLRRPKPDRR